MTENDFIKQKFDEAQRKLDADKKHFFTLFASYYQSNFEASVTYGRLIFQSLFLANGAALVALPAYVLVNIEPSQNQLQHVHDAAICFAIGLLFALLGMYFAWANLLKHAENTFTQRELWLQASERAYAFWYDKQFPREENDNDYESYEESVQREHAEQREEDDTQTMHINVTNKASQTFGWLSAILFIIGIGISISIFGD